LLLVSPAYAQQWSGVVGIEHISSYFDGKPFNSREETSIDMLYTGVRYKHSGWRAEVLVSAIVNGSENFEKCGSTLVVDSPTTGTTVTNCEKFRNPLGSNPRAIFRIEREWNW
jgi:hypothetical protein